MKITQVDPPLSLQTTFGPAVCHFVWTSNDQLWWGCFQEETGECWWFPNHLVRLSTNFSEGRTGISGITLPPHLEAALTPHRARYGGRK